MKKNKALDCTKLEYYKEIYHIIFLITQIPGQQCHGGDSLRTWVHWTRVLFRTWFYETRILKKVINR